MIICHGVLFWSSLLGDLEVSCTNGQNFLKIWEIFCYFIEYVMYVLYLLFFNAHDSQVWSFDGVSEFLHIPFTALELFKISSVFFFNFYFMFEL
jgi:hypothetical protein